MATRASIVGIGAAALVALGLAAGFARAQTSDPPRLGDVVRVSPPASPGPASRSPRTRPEPTGTAGHARGGGDGRAVTPPRPPGSDDDDDIDDDADDD